MKQVGVEHVSSEVQENAACTKTCLMRRFH